MHIGIPRILFSFHLPISNGIPGAQVPIDLEYILQCLLSDWDVLSGAGRLFGASLEIFTVGAVSARFTADRPLFVSADLGSTRLNNYTNSSNGQQFTKGIPSLADQQKPSERGAHNCVRQTNGP